MNGIEVHWITPIGPMRGIVSLSGIRTLAFPPADRLKLPRRLGRGGAVTWSFMSGAPDEKTLRLVRPVIEQIASYLSDTFQGRRPQVDPPLDWRDVGDFDRRVWRAARRIGWGRTTTYGELARRIGRAGAARAVGGALGRNRLVLLVPCHRIVAMATRGGNRLGGFGGGVELKKFLLLAEGVRIADSAVVGAA